VTYFAYLSQLRFYFNPQKMGRMGKHNAIYKFANKS